MVLSRREACHAILTLITLLSVDRRESRLGGGLDANTWKGNTSTDYKNYYC